MGPEREQLRLFGLFELPARLEPLNLAPCAFGSGQRLKTMNCLVVCRCYFSKSEFQREYRARLQAHVKYAKHRVKQINDFKNELS
jgi:hypothetical protein